MKIYVKTSRVLPQDGIFWVIGDQFIQFSDEVSWGGLQVDPIDLTHFEVWKQIGKDFKVDGKMVPFDYFPRGRVVISSGTNKKYKAEVFMDKCIKSEWWSTVLDKFGLNLSNCEVVYGGTEGFGSFYKCHECK